MNDNNEQLHNNEQLSSSEQLVNNGQSNSSGQTEPNVPNGTDLRDPNIRRVNPRYKKAFFRYLSVLAILLMIVGIWYYKNASEKPAPVADNPDFALNVTDTLDLEKLKSYGLPILIDFGADYCEPCRQLAPIIEELNSELQGKAIVRYVDTSVYPEIAQNYPVSVIPTQIFINADGTPYNPESSVAQMIRYTLKTTGEHVYTAHEGVLSKEDLLAVLTDMGMK